MVSIPIMRPKAFSTKKIQTNRQELVSCIIDSLWSGDKGWKIKGKRLCWLTKNGIEISVIIKPFAYMSFETDIIRTNLIQKFRLWLAYRKWFAVTGKQRRLNYEDHIVSESLRVLKSK